MTIKAKLSAVVANQFPDFYKEEGENFLAFIEAYYEYMEQNGKLTDAIQNLENYKDINTTLDEYLLYFQETLLPSVPYEVVSDKKLLAKYVKNFNNARGTLSSYKLLFRAIYDEPVEINFPADQMLKVSDGDWNLDRYLVTTHDKKNYELIGKTIKGTESKAEALVEDVVGRVINGRDLMQLNVSNVKGSFNHLETVALASDTNLSGHTAIIEAGISKVDIQVAGAQYAAGDVVDILSTDTGAFGKVVVTDTVDLGGAITFTIVDGGSGYTAGFTNDQVGGTTVEIPPLGTPGGGDGTAAASFVIGSGDISDTFALSMNTNLVASNNIYGDLAPTVVDGTNTNNLMSSFQHTIIGSPTLGFPEQSEVVDEVDYRDNINARLLVANTGNEFVVGDRIYGASGYANGIVTAIGASSADGAAVLEVDTFGLFSSSIRNLANDSEDIEETDYWVSTRGDVPSPVNTIVAPDGSTTAENLIEDTNTGDHFLGVRSASVNYLSDGTKYVFSVFAKPITAGNKRYIGFRGMNVGGNYPIFDIQEGTVINDGTNWEKTRIEPAGNGWWRCSSVTAPAAATGWRIILQPDTFVGGGSTSDPTGTNVGYSYTGDNTSGASIWGAQIELGTELTAYQRKSDDETTYQGEYVYKGNSFKSGSGTNMGKVTSFLANTVGHHVVEFANNAGTTVVVGDEFVGDEPNTANTADSTKTGDNIYSFGVVKHIVSDTVGAYEHLPLANTVQSGTISSSGTTVTGTNVGVNLAKHDAIKAGSQTSRRVTAVTSANEIEVTPAFSPALSSAAYGKGGVYRNLVKARVTSNTTSTISATTQFNVGPFQGFKEGEGVAKVGNASIVANVAYTTSNTGYENVYTTLEDSLLFFSKTFGTIDQLSSRVGGSGFTVAPTVTVRENDIAALGIGEQYVTLQADDINWNTGNSQVTVLDTNDGLYQASSGARGDIKAGKDPSEGAPSTIAHSNGTYETTVRVWQKMLQRTPGNVEFANNATVAINIFGSEYVPGTTDTRSPTGTGSAKIVKIVDEGVLGDNANVRADVGADGTITGLRVVDSGFSHKQGEVVNLKDSGRTDSTEAVVKLTLQNVANSEGYYSSSRSHVSTKRGFIQDSEKYQEFSYVVQTPLSLERYKDVVLQLAHPAGQKLFGQYQSSSVIPVDNIVTANNTTRIQASGTYSINNGSSDITGSGSSMSTQFTNNGTIILEVSPNNYYRIPLNIVSGATSANTHTVWSNTSISNAKAYYITGQ